MGRFFFGESRVRLMRFLAAAGRHILVRYRMSMAEPVQDAPGKQAGIRRGPLSRRKRRVFAGLALCLPLIVLALLEAALRLAGFGGYAPTILEVGPTPAGTLCINDAAGPATYFFANKTRPGSANTFDFLTPKPKGTIRIFLGGESAAKGFPQPMCFAPSAFLEAMLRDIWPDRRVEVINLGTTAVASFPVLDMLSEAMDYEPDLLIVHCGNNEFFGAYGVASLDTAGRTPLGIRFNRALRRLALAQFAESLIHPPAAEESSKTLMEFMMGRIYIDPDDPLRAAATRNLGVHISSIIDRAGRRGIPVIVCTLPANERDLAPLGEVKLDHLSSGDRATVEASLRRSEATMKSNPAASAKDLAAALALYPQNARAHFLLGQAQFAARDYSAASASFQRAIDFDTMPWRCPGPSNQAIRDTAKNASAVLCDLQQAFREASPGGCVGWELMDDHVHPTLLGQALTAHAIVHAMTRLSGPLAVPADAPGRLPSNEAYLRRLGENLYDRYGVASTVRAICNIPFYRATNPLAYDRFDRICRDLEATMAPEVLAVARKWEDPDTHPGAKRPITGMVGRVMIRLNRFADAEPLYELARRSVARYSSWNLEYNYFLLVSRERLRGRLSETDLALAAECIERGKFLLAHSRSESGMAERYTGRLHQLRGEWQEAVPFLLAARPKVTGTDLVAVDQALVMSYVRIGRAEDARRLIQDGIERSGQYADLYRQMLPLLEKKPQ